MKGYDAYASNCGKDPVMHGAFSLVVAAGRSQAGLLWAAVLLTGACTVCYLGSCKRPMLCRVKGLALGWCLPITSRS